MTATAPIERGRAWLSIAIVALGGLAGCARDDGPENTSPAVPPTPALNRVELDAFELAWPASADDTTPTGAISYEVGIVDSDICIVEEADVRLVGETELGVRLDDAFESTPFVGFTVRALDREGRSSGYGPCVWGLREPVRLPVPMVTRRPRLPDPPALGPALGCRSDGHDGVWCADESELSHMRGIRWQAFPLPQPFELVGWTPVDDYNALVRSEQVQLHLSRANGSSASVISSASQRFDPAAGAISTGRQRAYVGVRGFVGEFETRHIDMAGPPQPALALPGLCDRLLQLGYERRVGFALCQTGAEHHLYIGQPERRLMAWRTDPIVVTGDRVEGLVGRPDRGWLAVSSPDGAELIEWDDEGVARRQPVDAPSGAGRPVVAVAGTAEAPFVVTHRRFDYRVFDGASWRAIPEEPGPGEPGPNGVRLRWHGVAFPRVSHIVGTHLGVYAISDERTVRLTTDGAELLLVHPGPAMAARGHDARTYLLRGPELREVLSAREGLSWFTHSWRGPPLEPHDLAVTPAGGIYISGLTRQPDQPPEAARAVVLKLTSDGASDATPPLPPSLEGDTAPLALARLAADQRGRLYAHLLGHVAVLDAGAEAWRIIGPVPGRLIGLVGLDNGAVAALQTPDGPGLLHCQHELCVEIPVPAAARRPWGGIMRHGDGFCVGVRSRALWCREGQDDAWIDVRVGPALASQFGLGPGDDWDILSGVEPAPGEWLLAVRGETDGFLVAVDTRYETTGLLARGIDWAEGDVLLPLDDVAIELGRVVAVERDGPAEIRYGDSRVAVPGTLYR